LIARPIDTAVATGLLRDAQSKFNINNLIDSNGKRRNADVQIFVRLLNILKLDPELANAVVDWLDNDDEISGTGGAENGHYWSIANRVSGGYGAANKPILLIDELLRVKGMNEASFRRLAPFITALPRANIERTKININTTSTELLTAIFDDVTSDVIADVIRQRQAPLPYTRIDNIKQRHAALPAPMIDAFLDTTSRYFEASLAITGQHSQIRQAALLQTQLANTSGVIAWPAIIWVKENG
jgi:general secretion pathway protein K